MTRLITLTRLARKLDVSPGKIQRRIKSKLLRGVAETSTGVPLFDAAKLDEIRNLMETR